MKEYMVLRTVELSSRHKPTGYTRHYYGNQELPPPSALQIVKLPDDPGYYLLYLDNEGNELTDTYHETLESALVQAELEFKVVRTEWQVVSG